MKIKRIKKKYIVSGVMLVALLGAVGVGVYKANIDTGNVNAYQLVTLGVPDNLDEIIEYSNNYSLAGASGTYPAYYDVRDEVGGNVRNKNQNSEGLCWLYSATTAMEYALAKQHWYYEVSVKHFDYLMTMGGGVYKQDNVTNVYFDRYVSVNGAFRRWSMGTSGASEEVVYGVINPLAIMSESNFVSVMKANDTRLAGITRYEDIWNLSNKDSILEINDERDPAYLEKQDFNAVNDASKTDFVVTGAKMLWFAFDSSRTADSAETKTIKGIVDEYGALVVHVPFEKWDNCGDVTNGQYTIVNNGTPDCYTNHGMTIVGWDDNWEYEYDGQTRRGAFILQNSWGETTSEKSKWHVAYISALADTLYYDGIERYDSYDYYYGPNNYRGQTITPEDSELIYEISSRNSAQLEAITFASMDDWGIYEVYVSVDGDAANFVKDGVLRVDRGISKYEFNNDYQIDSNYAIKLKKTGGLSISSAGRSRGTINVLASKSTSYNKIIKPYVLDAERGYLDLTSFHTRVNAFKDLFGNNYEVTVDTKVVDNSNNIYTGGETKIYANTTLLGTYTNIIRGDIDGDGGIGTLDCDELREDIMDEVKLQDEYMMAGDMNDNNEIDAVDYIRVKKKITEE